MGREQKAFYDTQPDVLPKTLTGGVSLRKRADLTGRVLRIDYCGIEGPAYFCPGRHTLAKDVDWTTVPLPASTPPARSDVGPPPAVDWTKTCCQCGCARDDHSPTCSYFKKPSEPVRGDPYLDRAIAQAEGK